MRNLWRLTVFVKKYWGRLLLALFGMIAGTAFSLTIPRVLGRSIDMVMASGQRNNLLLAGAIILGASALRGMMAYVNRFLTQVVSQRVSYDVRNKLYNHLQRLSFAYYDKAQTGQLMSRATVDIEAMRMFFGEGLLGVLQIVLLVGGVTYLLMTLNWKLALITLAFMPLIAWRAIAVGNSLRPVWLKVQQTIAALGTTLQESLSGARVVKAFSLQADREQRVSADAEKLYNAQVGAARL